MIINLTQHLSTAGQQAAGAVDLPEDLRGRLKGLLTFDELPRQKDITRRAVLIARMAICNDLGPEDGEDPFPYYALIGGAPWLMGPLEAALQDLGIIPVYAFTRREIQEETQPDGSVRKLSRFVHEGFIGMDDD